MVRTIIALVWPLLISQSGSVVRITPNTLCFDTGTALHTIYGPRSCNNNKSEYYVLQQQPPGHPSLFSETDKERHARLRRVMANGFSDRAIRSQEAHVLVTTQALRRFIDWRCEKNSWSSTINMADLAAYFTFDVMGRTTFSKQFDLFERADQRYIKKIIIGNAQYTNAIACYPFALTTWLMTHNVFRFVPGELAQLAKESKLFEEYTTDLLKDRSNGSHSDKSDAKDSADFFTYVQNFTDPETGTWPDRRRNGFECTPTYRRGR